MRATRHQVDVKRQSCARTDSCYSLSLSDSSLSIISRAISPAGFIKESLIWSSRHIERYEISYLFEKKVTTIGGLRSDH